MKRLTAVTEHGLELFPEVFIEHVAAEDSAYDADNHLNADHSFTEGHVGRFWNDRQGFHGRFLIYVIKKACSLRTASTTTLLHQPQSDLNHISLHHSYPNAKLGHYLWKGAARLGAFTPCLLALVEVSCYDCKLVVTLEDLR